MKSKLYCIEESKSAPKILGNGSKGLLIVIRESDRIENSQTLEGLVKAIKYDINEDVTIVSCVDEFTPINPILDQKNYTSVILMGVQSNEIGFAINAKKNFFYKMENFALLITDSLSEMNVDKSKKLAFWQNLQSKFLS